MLRQWSVKASCGSIDHPARHTRGLHSPRLFLPFFMPAVVIRLESPQESSRNSRSRWTRASINCTCSCPDSAYIFFSVYHSEASVKDIMRVYGTWDGKKSHSHIFHFSPPSMCHTDEPKSMYCTTTMLEETLKFFKLLLFSKNWDAMRLP